MSSPPARHCKILASVCHVSLATAAGVNSHNGLFAWSNIRSLGASYKMICRMNSDSDNPYTWAAIGACITPGTSLLAQGPYTRSQGLLSLCLFLTLLQMVRSCPSLGQS